MTTPIDLLPERPDWFDRFLAWLSISRIVQGLSIGVFIVSLVAVVCLVWSQEVFDVPLMTPIDSDISVVIVKKSTVAPATDSVIRIRLIPGKFSGVEQDITVRLVEKSPAYTSLSTADPPVYRTGPQMQSTSHDMTFSLGKPPRGVDHVSFEVQIETASKTFLIPIDEVIQRTPIQWPLGTTFIGALMFVVSTFGQKLIVYLAGHLFAAK